MGPTWNINLGASLNYDSTVLWLPRWSKGMQFYASGSYQSGLRYTPQVLEGYNSLGRPLYRSQNENYLAERATPWINVDLRLIKTVMNRRNQGVTFSIEVRNLLNNKNAQIINPVTGTAYRAGDNVPNDWRDPRYVGPEENGVPPTNPARYLAPRQLLFGIKFRI